MNLDKNDELTLKSNSNLSAADMLSRQVTVMNVMRLLFDRDY